MSSQEGGVSFEDSIFTAALEVAVVNKENTHRQTIGILQGQAASLQNGVVCECRMTRTGMA
jgi:hypothetical protein